MNSTDYAIPADVVSALDYERYAQQRMHPMAWAYIQGGAGAEGTLQSNREAFQKYPLINRVLNNLDGGHCRFRLFGYEYASPIFLAPAAAHTLCHPQGEIATVLAASAMQCGAVISTEASVDIEQIKQAAHSPLFFQLYVQEDRGVTRALIERIELLQYQAIVLTVDAPVSGRRYRELGVGFTKPEFARAVNLPPQRHSKTLLPTPQSSIFDDPKVRQALNWEELEQIMANTRLPVILKGILHEQDALEGIKRGAAAIMVSNHGARLLDGMAASIDCLQRVSQSVAGQVPLLFDGGIRSGSDILKALALGADAVMIGRPYLYALAVGGAPGVAHLLHILKTELEMAMILTGHKTLAQIKPTALAKSMV